MRRALVPPSARLRPASARFRRLNHSGAVYRGGGHWRDSRGRARRGWAAVERKIAWLARRRARAGRRWLALVLTLLGAWIVVSAALG